MTLTPILTASPEIQIHAFAATLAVLSGPVALYRHRRDTLHKGAGYVWVLAMATAAISSFWIKDFGMIGWFSPIHGLSVLALWSLWMAMRAVFAGRYTEHAQIMRNLYWRGLMIAGVFQFLPGRTMNRMVLNDHRDWGYAVIALGLGLIVWGAVRQVRHSKRKDSAVFA